MKKDARFDIRLTDAQDAWLSEQAEKATIGKSTYVRHIIEQARRGRIQLIEEAPGSYTAGPENPKPGKSKPRKRNSA